MAQKITITHVHQGKSTLLADFDYSDRQLVPAFLNDHHPQTPGFALPLDFRTIRRNLRRSKVLFRQRVERQLEEGVECSPSQMYARWQPNAKYCQLCRKPFSSYRQHVRTQVHRRALDGSLGHSLIMQLAGEYAEASRNANRAPTAQ